jgi:hypothetical protein
MKVQITDAGVALMQAATSPIILTSYSLGSAYGYNPATNQTTLQGTLVKSGIPYAPVVTTENSIKYSIYLNDADGPFSFGEILLKVNNTVFAVCVFDQPVNKLPFDPITDAGGSYLIDIFTSEVSGNYSMWTASAYSSSMRASAIVGPEALPSPSNAIPNVFVVSAISNSVASYFAYTDRQGIWNFDKYKLALTVPVLAATTTTLTFSSDAVALMAFSGLGTLLVQGVSGTAYGACRYVSATGVNAQIPNSATVTLNVPLFSVPQVGDEFQFLTFYPSALPIGEPVYDKTGSQVLFTAVTSQASVILPVATATTKGTVSVGSGLSVDANGVLSAATPLATTTNPGLVSVGAGLSVSQAGVLSANVQALNPATATTLGGVKVGTGLSIDSNGLLSSTATQLLPATTQTLGSVIVGSGLSVTNGGVLSANPSPATATRLGSIMIGSGLTVDANGVVSTNGTGGTTVTLNTITGTISASQFASNIQPIGIVSAVPSSYVTSTIFNTTNQTLLTWNGTAYQSVGTSATVSALPPSTTYPGMIWVSP